MADPSPPTRAELARAFNGDKRLIEAFEEMFHLVPDVYNQMFEELTDAQFSWIGPALNKLGGQLFEQNKDVADLVQLIAADKSQIARVEAFSIERDRVTSSHREIIASLLATVGTLNAQIAEATKQRAIQFKSAAYQMLNDDAGVVADTSGGNFDSTMPDPTKNTGKEYFLQNAGSSNAVAKPFDSELFSGESEISIRPGSPFPSVVFKSDGINWIVT